MSGPHEEPSRANPSSDNETTQSLIPHSQEEWELLWLKLAMQIKNGDENTHRDLGLMTDLQEIGIRIALARSHEDDGTGDEEFIGEPMEESGMGKMPHSLAEFARATYYEYLLQARNGINALRSPYLLPDEVEGEKLELSVGASLVAGDYLKTPDPQQKALAEEIRRWGIYASFEKHAAFAGLIDTELHGFIDRHADLITPDLQQ